MIKLSPILFVCLFNLLGCVEQYDVTKVKTEKSKYDDQVLVSLPKIPHH